MDMKRLMTGFVFIIAVAAALVSAFNRPARAEDVTPGRDAEIIKRLDDIAKDQKTILEELAALKQELYVVKIRVSQNQ